MITTLVTAALAAAPGAAQHLTLDVDGQELRYTLSTPARSTDGQRHPLVVALHYGGPVSPWYGHGVVDVLVEPGLRGVDPYIVAPDCPGDGWGDPRSEAAVLALLDHALATLPVDPERVVLTGFSLGGMGTWALASRHPERFSAAIPVAGHPAMATDAIRAVPLYVLHGRRDEVIPIAPTEAKVAELRAAGVELVYETVNLTHYDTAAYARPLSKAVPWLRALWADAP